MVRAVYVPNADGTWTMYDKFEDMVEAIYSIKPDEITLVASLLQRYMRGYTAQFALTNVRCPHCGQLTKRIPIDVTYLVFLKYQRLGEYELRHKQRSSFISEVLTLFKGELSFNDIMRNMTYKDMIALRDARVDQLIKEREESEKEAERRNREMRSSK